MDYDVADMGQEGGSQGGTKLLICMIGLSGCGKTFGLIMSFTSSFVAHRIRKFLTWKGYNAKVITCAETRIRHYPQFASPPPEFFCEQYPEVDIEMVNNA